MWIGKYFKWMRLINRVLMIFILQKVQGKRVKLINNSSLCLLEIRIKKIINKIKRIRTKQ